MRLAWRYWPSWLTRLATAAAGYVVLAGLSGPAAGSPGWLKLTAGLGAVAFALAAGAAVTGAFLRLPDRHAWRGPAQVALGAAALAGALAGQPPGGYHGRPLFWAWSTGIGGVLTILYGLPLLVSGWRDRPAALIRESAELDAAAEGTLAGGEENSAQDGPAGAAGGRHKPG